MPQLMPSSLAVTRTDGAEAVRSFLFECCLYVCLVVAVSPEEDISSSYRFPQWMCQACAETSRRVKCDFYHLVFLHPRTATSFVRLSVIEADGMIFRAPH